MNQLKRLLPKIDPYSLRVRLSVGVAGVSALGLSSLSIWTSWKMQHLLINKHKNNIQQIATRLPHDIELYNKMMPSADGVQKVIDNLSTNNTFLWIKSLDNKILAKSISLNQLS